MRTNDLLERIQRQPFFRDQIVHRQTHQVVLQIPVHAAGRLIAVKNPPGQRFHENGVELVDGRLEDFDAVILATGYRAAIDEFLAGAESLLNERGYPKLIGVEAEHPGPYFVGFGNPPTGLLREIVNNSSIELVIIARKKSK